MRDYGKIAGFVAAGAFLLSLVVGLASGNLFAAALVRAFLFALLFACLAAAARYVVMKYLPEVTAVQPSSEERAGGRAVDITLPEESPVAAARASAYRRSQDEAAVDAEPVSSEPGDAEQPIAGDLPDLEELSSGPAAAVERDLDDLLPPLPESGSGTGGPDRETDEDVVVEAESVEAPGEAGLETPKSEGMPDDLGALPDISTLGTGSHGPGQGKPRGARAGLSRRSSGGAESPPTPGDEMKGTLGSQDPSTLARAIRTVLKRDEKG